MCAERWRGGVEVFVFGSDYEVGHVFGAGVVGLGGG